MVGPIGWHLRGTVCTAPGNLHVKLYLRVTCSGRRARDLPDLASWWVRKGREKQGRNSGRNWPASLQLFAFTSRRIGSILHVGCAKSFLLGDGYRWPKPTATRGLLFVLGHGVKSLGEALCLLQNQAMEPEGLFPSWLLEVYAWASELDLGCDA